MRSSGLFLLACALAAAQAQVTFKDAFPGLTFKRPVYIGQMPGVSEKTFVVLEQHLGQATLVRNQNGKWTASVLVKLDVHQANEMGLLGIAFHPDFKNNHKYYVDYDPPGTMYNIVQERQTDATLMKDLPDSARILIKQPDKYDNHNGGTLAFGPKDHYLYIGMGDGGNGYDPDGNGQNVNVFLGKMLRIDVDKRSAGLPYGIPADNPFAAGGGKGEIFAYGFRNPWKWSFDPVNGDLWMGDVGQDATEEVDIVVKGGNYGWKAMEGKGGTNSGSMILPIYTYGHSKGNSCIIGGVVYRGNPGSKYYGTYFTADLSGHSLWNLTKNGTGDAAVAKVGTTPGNPTTFGTDDDGLIYLGTESENSPIYRLDGPDLGPAPVSIARGPRAYAPEYRPSWRGLRWRTDGRAVHR
jgi:glucose/arabinose dehydrogenase